MFGLGLPEMLLILLILILIFGASRLPELGRGVGEGIRNFKRSLRDEPDDDDKRRAWRRRRPRRAGTSRASLPSTGAWPDRGSHS